MCPEIIGLALLAVSVSGALAVLIAPPRNAAVFVGERMSMDCITDEGSTVRRWEVFDFTKTWSTVYSHGHASNFVNRFTHFGAEVNANGSGFIYTNSAKIHDGGIYRCFARGGDGRDVEASAQLIVFESEPMCATIFTSTDNDSLVDGRHVLMQCSVAFRGFWSPTMEWRRHDGKGLRSYVGKRITYGVEISRFLNNTVTSRINASARSSFFSCQVSFSQYVVKDVAVTATNIPDFFYFWSSEMTSGLDTEVCATTSSSPLYCSFISIACIVLVCFAAAMYLKYKRRNSGIIAKSVEEQSVKPMTEVVGVTVAQLPPAQDETKNEMAATSDQYCALETRLSITQDLTVYCEISSYEQQYDG